MKVVEMFASIDGEGVFAGCLASFVRFGGCNLRCRYCDTAYCQPFLGDDVTGDEIVNYVDSVGYQHVTLTGGEPLIHAGVYELVKKLTDNGYVVNIETNGSIDISDFKMLNTVITMDYKLDCSGETSKMNERNLRKLRTSDVLKFVTNASPREEERVFDIIDEYRPKAKVYLSPVFGKCIGREMVDMLENIHRKCRGDIDLEMIANRARVQMQLHKMLGCK